MPCATTDSAMIASTTGASGRAAAGAYSGELVAGGTFDSLLVLTQREPLTGTIEAYRNFDAREFGWIKVKLEP